MATEKPLILVTGSSGTIGYLVAQRLAALGFEVAGLDREKPPDPPPTAHCIPFDLTSEESVQSALREVKEQFGSRIASVIHLAAYYNFTGEDSPLYDQVTVQGTERLLHALRDFEVEQFLFSSTMLVHQPSEPGVKINEDDPLAPKWAYPESKARTEELIQRERGTIPAVILRIAAVYDDECHSLPLSHQIQRIYEQQLTGKMFAGNLDHGSSFIHLDDLVDAFPLIVERRSELPPYSVFLMGEEEVMTYGELQETLGCLIHGEEWATYQVDKPFAKVGAWVLDHLPGQQESFIKPFMIDIADDHYELDTTRARTLLDWNPKHHLRDSLPNMIADLKSDPLNWYRKNKLEPPDALKEFESEPRVNENLKAERPETTV